MSSLPLKAGEPPPLAKGQKALLDSMTIAFANATLHEGPFVLVDGWPPRTGHSRVLAEWIAQQQQAGKNVAFFSHGGKTTVYHMQGEVIGRNGRTFTMCGAVSPFEAAVTVFDDQKGTYTVFGPMEEVCMPQETDLVVMQRYKEDKKEEVVVFTLSSAPHVASSRRLAMHRGRGPSAHRFRL